MVAPAEKASLVGSLFDSKQCPEQFGIPLSCVPHSRCDSLAVRTLVLLRLLLDLDTFDDFDHLGVFPQILRMVANIIAPKLSIIFLGLIRRGSFPECWWSTNVTVISKGAPSPDRENYRPISITPILSKVYLKLVSHKLSSFCNKWFFA